MHNPWDDIEEAFEPMFTDAIAVDSAANRQTLQVIVFNDGSADVVSPDLAATDIERIQVVVRRGDWAGVELMKVGDRFEVLSTGKKYAIDSVDHDRTLGITLHARSV